MHRRRRVYTVHYDTSRYDIKCGALVPRTGTDRHCLFDESTLHDNKSEKVGALSVRLHCKLIGLERTRAEYLRAAPCSESYLQTAMEHAGAVMHAPKPYAVNTAILGRDSRAVIEHL